MRGSALRTRGLLSGAVAMALLAATALLSPAGATSVAARPVVTSETFPGQVGAWAVSAQETGAPAGIYLESVGGTAGTTPLVRGTDPDWSPNGRKIAFVRNGNLFTVRADGTDVTRVTAGASAPAWSPDGTKIAFARYGDLWTVRPDGNLLTRLTDQNAGDDQPAWSPDGTKIAFSSTREGDREIFVMASSGGAPTALTDNAVTDDAPDWSPDGTRIVFASAGELDVMAADGSGRSRLLATSRTILSSPSWSPDGARVAFVVDMAYSGRGTGVVDADGSDPGYNTGRGSEWYFHAVDWQGIPSSDHGAPKIDWLNPPGNGQVYARNSRHVVRFRCTDPNGVFVCAGMVTKPNGRVRSLASGEALPTASVGRFTIEITAQDTASNSTTASVTYDVVG